MHLPGWFLPKSPGSRLTSLFFSLFISFFAHAVLSSCAKEADDSPSRSIKDFMRGRWKSSCLPYTGGKSIVSNASSHVIQYSFNTDDGWAFDEYYSDDKCQTPLLRAVYAGTYALGPFWKVGQDQATSVDFSFGQVAVMMFDDQAVQSANNLALCGGGHTINSYKLAPINDCQLTDQTWGPRPNNIIRFEPGGLRPGEMTAQRHGGGSEFRPNTFDSSILLVRQ